MMRIVLSLAVCIVLSSCAGVPCLQKVAAVESGITTTLNLTKDLEDRNVINHSEAVTVVQATDVADVAAEESRKWCAVDEHTALDYVDHAISALSAANQKLGDYQ